jgi:hypothetical protein
MRINLLVLDRLHKDYRSSLRNNRGCLTARAFLAELTSISQIAPLGSSRAAAKKSPALLLADPAGRHIVPDLVKLDLLRVNRLVTDLGHLDVLTSLGASREN